MANYLQETAPAADDGGIWFKVSTGEVFFGQGGGWVNTSAVFDVTGFPNRTNLTMTGTEHVVGTESDAANAAGVNIPVSLLLYQNASSEYLMPWAASSVHWLGSKFSTTFFTGMRVSADSRFTDIISKSADSSGAVRFLVGPSEEERARINSAGNLGIGTSAPTAFGGYRSVHLANTGNVIQLFDANGTIGEVNVVSSSHAIFGTRTNHDVRFGVNNVSMWQLTTGGHLMPFADGARNLGGPINRPATIFSITPTINTCDEREKKWLQTGITPSKGNRFTDKIEPNAFYKAGLEIRDEFGFYQWLDAIDDKGEDGARIHFGPRAQRVFAILEKHGIDPARIAFCCFDEWEEEREPIFKTVKVSKKEKQPNPKFDPEKKVSARNKKEISVSVKYEKQVDTGKTKLIRKAGNRYGLRLDMLNAFLGSVRDRVQGELEARIEKLEPAQ